MQARFLLAVALLGAVALAGCTKEPAASDGEDDGCGIEDCPPTSTSSSSTAASGNASSSTSSSASSTSQAPRPAQTVDVTIQGFAFSPASITVQAGDTVRWTQKDTNLHTATSKAGAPEAYDSGDLDPVVKPTFSHAFQAVGTHEYFCKRHPGMTGTVTVVESLA